MNNINSEQLSKYFELVRQLDKVDELEYDDICDLETKLVDLQKDIKYYLTLLGIYMRTPLREEIDKVIVRKRVIEIEKSEEAEHFYFDKILTNESELVNGFNLYDCDYNLIEFQDYKELQNMWVKNKYISDEDMIEWALTNKHILSSWYYIDKNGVSDDFAIESNFEKNHITENSEALLELPYPREIIQYSVFVGKDTIFDSPRYCNFFCEWLKRKITNKYMYKEVCQYITKIKIFFNERENNKYLIAELVSIKYGHIYNNLYQIIKMI